MNKILNWTFGACFRTLGRFLAIFIVGVLLIFIGSEIGVELPDWLSLRVNAQTINGWASELPTLSRVDFRSCNSTDCSTNFNSVVDYFESPYELRTFTYNTNYMTIGNNGYSIMVPYYVNKDYLYEVNYYICSNVNIQTSNYNFDIYAAGYTSGNPFPHEYKLITRSRLDNIPIINGGRTFNSCNLFTGLIAPSQDSGWLSYRIRSSSNVSNVVLSVVAVQVNQLGLYSSGLDEVIKNSGFATADSVEQVQDSVNKVEEEIKKTQDTITNEDTQGAEDAASGFFSDFNTETFGLTSIITAPLNAINSIINSSCNSLVLPLPFVEKNLTLPCMNSIYSNYFKGFFDLYQIITTGLISYYIIVRIFNLVKDFKNPEHDEIEVMDL